MPFPRASVGLARSTMSSSTIVAYALGERSRCVAAVAGDGETVLAVGTQRLLGNNFVHFLAHDRDRNCLVNRGLYKHHPGEIWDLQPCPANAALVATLYNPSSGTGDHGGAVWRVPETTAGDSDSNQSLESIASFTGLAGAARCVRWQVGVGVGVDPQRDVSVSGTIATLDHNSLKIWELDASASTTMALAAESHLAESAAGFAIENPSSGAWDPHARANFAVVTGSGVAIFDTRAMQISSKITRVSHNSQTVLDCDYDQKKQHALSTCGDDGVLRSWDLRNPESAVAVHHGHEHSVFSVRINPVYELTASVSADGTARLWRDESGEGGGWANSRDAAKRSNQNRTDGNALVETYGSLGGGSVYGVCWSAQDPWAFATVRQDGEVALRQVPRAEKYRILL